eukprot:2973409-Pleurochrysis_carterae.AAC.1
MSKRKRRPISQSLLPTTRSTRPPRHRSSSRTTSQIAARKEHYVDPAFQKNYESKVGALIYAPPCGRPGE